MWSAGTSPVAGLHFERRPPQGPKKMLQTQMLQLHGPASAWGSLVLGRLQMGDRDVSHIEPRRRRYQTRIHRLGTDRARGGDRRSDRRLLRFDCGHLHRRNSGARFGLPHSGPEHPGFLPGHGPEIFPKTGRLGIPGDREAIFPRQAYPTRGYERLGKGPGESKVRRSEKPLGHPDLRCDRRPHLHP